jgi:hypothetical protein
LLTLVQGHPESTTLEVEHEPDRRTGTVSPPRRVTNCLTGASQGEEHGLVTGQLSSQLRGEGAGRSIHDQPLALHFQHDRGRSSIPIDAARIDEAAADSGTGRAGARRRLLLVVTNRRIMGLEGLPRLRIRLAPGGLGAADRSISPSRRGFVLCTC